MLCGNYNDMSFVTPSDDRSRSKFLCSSLFSFKSVIFMGIYFLYKFNLSTQSI